MTRSGDKRSHLQTVATVPARDVGPGWDRRGMSAPDRYADAVRARRAELRADRAALTGTHRAELRSELALARLAAGDALSDGLDRAAAIVRAHAARPGRAARRQLTGVLAAALTAAVGAAHACWAGELGAGLRRLAGARGLDLCGLDPDGLDGGSAWPPLPGPPTPRPPPGPPPRPWLAGAAEGLALWRLALLPLVALPLAGLPVLGGRAWTPLAVGVAAAGLALLIRARRIAADRAVLGRWSEAAIANARAAFVTHLDRAALSVEPGLAAELDAAVARRRAALERELAAVTDG